MMMIMVMMRIMMMSVIVMMMMIMKTGEDAYAKLVKLPVERRSRLEEARLLWQFYMAEVDINSCWRPVAAPGQTSRILRPPRQEEYPDTMYQCPGMEKQKQCHFLLCQYCNI